MSKKMAYIAGALNIAFLRAKTTGFTCFKMVKILFLNLRMGTVGRNYVLHQPNTVK
jgi:hypothetical protein